MSYKTETYTNKNGGQVQAHVVTAEEEGQTVTLAPGNRTKDVREGDVLLQGYHPDQYEEASEDFATEYSKGDGSTESTDAKDSGPEDVFEPADATAAEVRAYLSRDGLSDEERSRVETAERDGKNRSSAFPA